MTVKTRPHLPAILAALLLVGILAVTMASTSTAAAGPELPTETCDASTVGDLAYTYTGVTCSNPTGQAQYDEFVCTETSPGNFRWLHVRRSCVPFFTPQW